MEKNINALSFYENENDVREVIMTCLQNQNTQLNESELKEFVMLCMINKLNPLKREVYAVKYGDKFNIITSYMEYLKRADATGKLEYYHVTTESTKVGDKEFPKKAIFVGKRKDWSEPMTMELRFNEFSSGKSTWLTKPYFMLDKCARALGLRALFPNELGNMPYINEELWYHSPKNEDVIKEHVVEEEKNIDMSKVFAGAKNE